MNDRLHPVFVAALAPFAPNNDFGPNLGHPMDPRTEEISDEQWAIYEAVSSAECACDMLRAFVRYANDGRMVDARNALRSAVEFFAQLDPEAI